MMFLNYLIIKNYIVILLYTAFEYVDVHKVYT